MNLLKETIDDIKESGHTPEDIIFIGSERKGNECTWNEFKLLANVEYDDDYGDTEVIQDLVIVFSDGIKMYRSEHGGKEWWEYPTPFKRPSVKKPLTSLFRFP